MGPPVSRAVGGVEDAIGGGALEERPRPAGAVEAPAAHPATAARPKLATMRIAAHRPRVVEPVAESQFVVRIDV